MTIEEVRLKCLELGHRADRDSVEIIERAKRFEEYVFSKPNETSEKTHAIDKTGDAPAKKPGSSKKPGTQNPFND